MSQETRINRYWTQRGHTYKSEVRLAADYHRLQESFLLEVLRISALPARAILEIGCGYGRVTKVLAEGFPQSDITGLDLSEAQLANARSYCGGCTNVRLGHYDLYGGEALPGEHYDLAVAIEVFLHHPGDAVRTFLNRILALTQCIVSIDWCEQWQTPVSPHVWLHDYRRLYREAGLDCVSLALPRKVDGKQQRLFFAARALPDTVRQLERLLLQFTPATSEPLPNTAGQTLRATEPASWEAAVSHLIADLESVIPKGSTFIFLDDGQMSLKDASERWNVLPFLERDGRWWGPPENDSSALEELARMRQAGAAYFAFSWPSFWWTEHYAEFSQHLCSHFPCVLRNERLIVFDLMPLTKRSSELEMTNPPTFLPKSV